MSFFGKNIKKIRSVKNLSQQNFADLFDLKRATLGAYEEGRSEPKIENIIKVANYFSISIDHLLTRDLTVNELLKFKEGITTNIEAFKRENFTEIPCITEANLKEYTLHHDKSSFISQMPLLQLPLKNTLPLRGFTINNLEMSSHNKGFFPNDIVIGHYFPIDKLKDLINGTLVLVLIHEKLILRRIYTLKSKIVLKADHANIEDLSFDKKDLKEIWKIKYSFFKRIPEYKNDMENQLLLLTQELGKIKQQISGE